MFTTLHDGPLGPLRLYASPRGLWGLYWPEHRLRAPLPDARAGSSPHLDAARRQLDEYFAGRRVRFDLALDAVGTPFQVRVWRALVEIPFGATASYADLARRLGLSNGARAVGGANARNPISIVVPCHRVIAAGGALAGYAGGEAAKAWLLAHERATGLGALDDGSSPLASEPDLSSTATL